MVATAIFIIVLSLSAAFIFSFLGVGDEGDDYRNIAVWQHIVLSGEYLQSRTPGHVASELLIGSLTSFLPSAAVNLFIVACSVASLILFYFLTRPNIGAASAMVAIAFVASNPYWIALASASDETLLAALFFISGLAALKWRTPVATAVLFALATSSRVEYGPVSGLLLFWLGGVHSAARRRWVDGLTYSALFGFLCFLLWLPVLISHQMTFAFLEPMTKIKGGLLEYVVRFVYKTVMFFGLPASTVLSAVVLNRVWVGWKNHLARERDSVSWGERLRSGPVEAWLAGIIGAYFLLFFLHYPVEENLLLPVLYALPLFLLALKVNRWMILGAAFAQILTWLVNPALLQIDYASQGVGYKTKPVAARIHPHVAPGVLFKKAKERPLRDAFYLPRLPAPVPLQNVYDYARRTTERGSIRDIEDVVSFFVTDD